MFSRLLKWNFYSILKEKFKMQDLGELNKELLVKLNELYQVQKKVEVLYLNKKVKDLDSSVLKGWIDLLK